MHIVNLRKIGGSIMLAVPSALPDELHLVAGATVGLAIEHGTLVVTPRPRPHYTLDELLLQCDASKEISSEDQKWIDAAPVGGELI